MDHHVRAAVPADAPAIRTVLARAYDRNPLLRWVFPHDDVRPAATAMWLGPAIAQYRAMGVVHGYRRFARSLGDGPELILMARPGAPAQSATGSGLAGAAGSANQTTVSP